MRAERQVVYLGPVPNFKEFTVRCEMLNNDHSAFSATRKGVIYETKAADPAEPLLFQHVPQHTVLATDLSQQESGWWHFGINWLEITKRALRPANVDYFSWQSYVFLGKVEQLLPSGKWYPVTHVGVSVTPEVLRQDIGYLAGLTQSAANYGARIETDEMGECLYAVFDLKPCLMICGVPVLNIDQR